ncbi:MAG: hypothetical protein EXS55_02210 [Candidatus Magasanikbacteria bacterium]|nr:hypothetical protein [Candidatus Magasanikbacteria bacterium]
MTADSFAPLILAVTFFGCAHAPPPVTAKDWREPAMCVDSARKPAKAPTKDDPPAPSPMPRVEPKTNAEDGRPGPWYGWMMVELADQPSAEPKIAFFEGADVLDPRRAVRGKPDRRGDTYVFTPPGPVFLVSEIRITGTNIEAVMIRPDCEISLGVGRTSSRTVVFGSQGVVGPIYKVSGDDEDIRALRGHCSEVHRREP